METTPIFFGGADQYASARSNLTWRLEFFPNVSQLQALMDRGTKEKEQRENLVHEVERLKESVAKLEAETNYWRVFNEEWHKSLWQRTNNMSLDISDLSGSVASMEPVVRVIKDAASSLVRIKSTETRTSSTPPPTAASSPK